MPRSVNPTLAQERMRTEQKMDNSRVMCHHFMKRPSHSTRDREQRESKRCNDVSLSA
ncbi:hypothetical protein SAMN02745129_1247 [Ferrimonas marina]|uniref:Uncharacterized protein n=1 Tax=Ferrimonas marina TaxID=299255 RepID=A0A1M5P0P5_9GAMM|nr:hypothetical protein SAMN02745129_1247 [Ferrimonas marina]